MTIGIYPKATNENSRFVEFYSPEQNQWSLGPNPRYLRNRPEAVVLPDGRVLAFGGQYSDLAAKPRPPLRNAGTMPNCTRLTDIYDPVLNTWRAGSDMNRYIHYHNVTVLVPDGRVIATGGAGLTANNSFAGDDMSIEAYEPPFLFRGVRPQIKALSSTDLTPGSTFDVQVGYTDSPTEVVLVSARASTHWVDGGPQRQLSLPFTDSSGTLRATVPDDAVKALAGWYILFVLVDDIPSEGRIVRMLSQSAPAVIKPTVSLTILTAISRETGGNAEVMISHTGRTNAPLRIDYELSGTAVNGTDYNVVSNSVTIPEGSSSVTLRVVPRSDGDSEGDERVSIALRTSPAYSLGGETEASLIIKDAASLPPASSMYVSIPSDGFIQPSFSGPSTRLVAIERTFDLQNWVEFGEGITVSNQLDLIIPNSEPFSFFRAVDEP